MSGIDNEIKESTDFGLFSYATRTSFDNIRVDDNSDFVPTLNQSSESKETTSKKGSDVGFLNVQPITIVLGLIVLVKKSRYR